MATTEANALPALLYHRPAPLLTLPPELICEVAEHLESLEEIKRFRLTSTSIASAAAFVLARKFCNEKELEFTFEGLGHLAGRCLHPHFATSLRSLIFRSAPAPGFSGLPEQASVCLQKSLEKLPDLKVIEFRRESYCTPSFPMNNKEPSTLLSAMQSTGHLLEALALYELLGISERPGINSLSPWTPEAKFPTALRKLSIRLLGTVPNGDCSAWYSHLSYIVSSATNISELEVFDARYLSDDGILASNILPQVNVESITKCIFMSLDVKPQMLLSFLEQRANISSIRIMCCSLLNGSWEDILISIRDHLHALSEFGFRGNRHKETSLFACTVWDGRPLFTLYGDDPDEGLLRDILKVEEEDICGEDFIWVDMRDEDDGTMLQDMIAESGLPQALNDFITGYCEVEYQGTEVEDVMNID